MKKYILTIGCALIAQITMLKAQSSNYERFQNAYREEQIRELQSQQHRMENQLRHMGR